MPFVRKTDSKGYQPPTDISKLFIGHTGELVVRFGPWPLAPMVGYWPAAVMMERSNFGMFRQVNI